MIRDSRGTRLVLGALLAVAFVLVTIDTRAGERSPLDPLRGLAAGVFGPLEQAARAATRPVGRTVGTISRIAEHEDQIARLQRENAALRARAGAASADRVLEKQLDALLGAAGRGRYEVVPARVVALDADRGFSWSVAIDVGTGDGVRRDMTVVNGDGLVGRVVSAGPHTATVLLAVDPISSVGVRVLPSREIGTVDGLGTDPPRLRLFDQRARLDRGSRLVTFGSRGARPFVPGVPVGEILQVRSLPGGQPGGQPGGLSQVATVRPYVDFTSLDVVGVVVEPPRSSARKKLGG
jgi:rod shape-determining protein MreC